MGGDVLFVEATAMPGKGRLIITGQLGDVMRESAQAALSYVRSHETDVAPGLEGDWFAEHDVHLQIADSGVGFDPVAIDHAGLGLVSMRERVGVLKGDLVINASPGRGTRIGVRVPLIPSARDGQSPYKSA